MKFIALTLPMSLVVALAGCSASDCGNVATAVHATKLVQASLPDIAAQQGVEGTTIVAVTVDDGGSVVAAKIRKSAGNAALDASAIVAAKQSTYAPGSAACRAVGGTIGYETDFSYGGSMTVSI